MLAMACRQKAMTTQPVVETITESVYASGIIKSENQYEVYATVNGIATHLWVKEGDSITKGSPIIQVAHATAQLNTDNAQIAADYAARAANNKKLEELLLGMQQAKRLLDNDALLLDRQRNLWNQQIGTRNQLEQRELACKNSQTNYEAAALQYQELERDIRFREQQALKNLAIARSQAGDYTIKSEYSGKVYDLLIEQGEHVGTQQPVAVIGDATAFLLELQVDEYDIARIKPGQKIIVTMDSYRGQVFTAAVTRLIPIMNERTKTFTVEAGFMQAPPMLYPRLTCEANIIITQKDKALTIPRTWLMEGDYVLLANKDKRKVTTGLRDYHKVEIMAGLSAADLIIKPQP
ncbi:MAG: efflux RND transporter periplasmic adaptor subunit [Niastella sp.]|nr:efflux RND transporter periplasmic adaptor subunit [Niastella sp.]